jgi:hypothetical protein
MEASPGGEDGEAAVVEVVEEEELAEYGEEPLFVRVAAVEGAERSAPATAAGADDQQRQNSWTKISNLIFTLRVPQQWLNDLVKAAPRHTTIYEV